MLLALDPTPLILTVGFFLLPTTLPLKVSRWVKSGIRQQKRGQAERLARHIYHITACFVTLPTHATSLPKFRLFELAVFTLGEVSSRVRLANYWSGNGCAPGRLAYAQPPFLL